MQPASNAIQSIASQSKECNQMQPASNAIQSIAIQSKQSNQANAINSKFTTLPVTTYPLPILHYLTQPNAVGEKYTILKNKGAKVWVTHGRLRGLTFEHLKTKLSPGRGWHFRDSSFRSWTNPNNTATVNFESNPIQLNCNPIGFHRPAFHSRKRSSAIQQK